DRHRSRLGPIDQVTERAAELVDGECARIEDPVGELAEPAELLPLAADAVRDPPALVGGMGSPRLAEAADEPVGARLEGAHLARNVLRPELDEHSRALRGAASPAAAH